MIVSIAEVLMRRLVQAAVLGVIAAFSATASANLAYNGGGVATTPRLLVAYWGWGALGSSTQCPNFPGTFGRDPAGYLPLIDTFLSKSEGSKWFETMTQYYQQPSPVFSPVYIANPTTMYTAGSYYVSSSAPNTPSQTDYNSFVSEVYSYFGVPATTQQNALAVVVGNCMQDYSLILGSSYDARHNSFGSTLLFAMIPYPRTIHAGVSVTGGTGILEHEIVEAITDPIVGDSWNNPGPAGEIGDLCEGVDPNGNWLFPEIGVQLTPGTAYPVRAMWSNEISSCAYSRPSHADEAWIASGTLYTYGCGAWATGVTMVNDPGMVSWGRGRFDVGAYDASNNMWQGYTDGSCANRGIARLPKPVFGGTTYCFNNMVTASCFGAVPNSPDVSSWGDSHLDMWGVAAPCTSVCASPSTQHLASRTYDNRTGGWDLLWTDRGAPPFGIGSGVGTVSWGVSDVYLAPGSTNVGTRTSYQPRVDAFVLDGQSSPHIAHYDGSIWQDLGTPPGYVLAGDPDVCSWGSRRLDVVVNSKTTGGGPGPLWHLRYDGTPVYQGQPGYNGWIWEAWGSPSSQNITTGTSPTCVALGDERVIADVNTMDGHIWRRQSTGSSVSWYDLGAGGGRNGDDLGTW